MTLEAFLSTVAALSGLTFVVASMLATGLSLTMAQILQPLKNARLVILALLANFVLVPLLAFGDHPGAPARPVAADRLDRAGDDGGRALPGQRGAAAKGNLSLGVGLMFLLMVVTIFYVPLVLPLLLPGVEVNAVGHRQVADRDHAHPHRARPDVSDRTRPRARSSGRR